MNKLLQILQGALFVNVSKKQYFQNEETVETQISLLFPSL